MEDDPLVDTVVADRYRVLRRLGEGAMSRVYEVQHTKLARAFALKSLLPTLVRNNEAIQRFSLEAELLASLRHPNVVDISDWVTLPDGAPCMILEFLHGASLGVRLQRNPLAWDAIARMGDQAMSALQLAHRMGIIHRDLKPDNIFISIDDVGEERVKIVDFGVSKLSGSTRLSGAHEIVGTPSYMSPEQAQGLTDQMGPATDVWAMGTILYEMATQKVAFDATTVAEALMRIVSGHAEPLLEHRKDAPPAFVELVERAISRDARRILTIEELRAGLRKALAAPVAPPPQRGTRERVGTPLAGSPVLVPRTASPSNPVPNVPRTLTPSGLTVLSAPPMPRPALDDDKKRLVTLGIVAAVLITMINVVIALAL
ncbi:MAG: serine/threonine protein kinase [Myxococcota bacterium]|nr:serine/threonine protein kinase [Myxococcota bacterium]